MSNVQTSRQTQQDKKRPPMPPPRQTHGVNQATVVMAMQRLKKVEKPEEQGQQTPELSQATGEQQKPADKPLGSMGDILQSTMQGVRSTLGTLAQEEDTPGKQAMQSLAERESADLDMIEQTLMDAHGHHFLHFKAAVVKKPERELVGKPPAYGWEKFKMKERQKKLDDITKDAVKRKAKLATHDYMMERGEMATKLTGQLPDSLVAFKIYYQLYTDAIDRGRKTSDARADAEKGLKAYAKGSKDKKKPDYLAMAKDMQEKDAAMKEMQAFRDKCRAEDGIEVEGSTLKAMQEDYKKKIKDKAVDDRRAILEQEKQMLYDSLGMIFVRELNRQTAAFDVNKLSYDQYRKLIHKARDNAIVEKQITEQHERMMKIPEYVVVYTRHIAEARLTTNEEKREYLLKNFKKIDKEATLSRATFYSKTEESAKKAIAEIQKNKNMTADQKEEAAHRKLDELEAKHAADGAHSMGVTYTPVGKTVDGKELKSGERLALIKKQLHLLEKHETRYAVSEDYATEFDKLKAENDQIEEQNKGRDEKDRQATMSDAEMVKKSTQKGLDARKGILKQGKKERLEYHGHQMLDAKEAKYREKYKHFDAALRGESFGKQMKEAKIRAEVIKRAKELAIKVEHEQNMAESPAYAREYKAYEGTVWTQKRRRKFAAKEMRHESLLKNDEYKQMYAALSSRPMLEKTARRKAEKHMRRMEDGQNPAYKQGFEQALKAAKDPSNKSALRAARDAGRTSAKIARDTEKDVRLREKYGEEIYDTARMAYGEKYKDSASKSRKHARERAKNLSMLEEHQGDLANTEGYKLAYETAIAAGKTHSDAREAALKQAEKAQKANAKSAKYQGRATEDADRYPDMEAQMQFYTLKYPGDPKKAYKHALDAAKAMAELRGKVTTARTEVFDHPLFKKTFAEAYEATGDARKATDQAYEAVTKAIEADKKRKDAGRSVAENQEGMSARQKQIVDKWADSTLVKVVRKIREINKTDPSEPKGLVEKILSKLTSPITDREKSTVDAPQQKKQEGGPGYGPKQVLGNVGGGLSQGKAIGGKALTVKRWGDVAAGNIAAPKPGERFDGAPSFLKNTGLVETVRGKIDEKAEEGGIIGMGFGAVKTQSDTFFDGAKLPDPNGPSGFTAAALTGLLGPLIGAVKMAKEIVEYIKDSRKGLTTDESTQALLEKVILFLPNLQKANTSVLTAIDKAAVAGVGPIVGTLQTALEQLSKMTVNAMRLHHATVGAKAIRKNLNESKVALRDRRNRDVFVLKKGTVSRKTKDKVDLTLVRNALAREEEKEKTGGKADDERVDKLKTWQRDHEYKRLYEKLIRERSLDIAQNLVGITGAVASLVPTYGQLAKGAVELFNQGVTAVRGGVKAGKQMGRELAAAKPMSGVGKVFDIDRSTANKHRDRAMFALMVYNELAALPLPEEAPSDDVQERDKFLASVTRRYQRMHAYTTLAMDMRGVLKAGSKETVLKLLIQSMAASSHAGA